MSLCSGYGGIDLAVSDLLGADLVAYAEIDPGAVKIMAHRFPGVPNHGDITEIDWHSVGHMDVLSMRLSVPGHQQRR